MRWQSQRERELTAVERVAVHLRDGGSCVWCGSTERLHVDHVHPVRRGGSNALGNLQTLCGPCNWWKGKHLIELVRRSGRLYARRS